LIKNKKILITGCSSGLGLSLTRELALYGNKIYCLGKRKIIGNNIKSVKCNLKNIKKIKNNLRRLINHKPLDYIILNAGILGEVKKINELSVNEIEEAFKINFLSNKEIIDYFINNKIKTDIIIAISSGAALSPKVGWYPYCGSKSALKFLMESYAIEFSNRKFINIAPGLIKTKMQDQICKIDAKKINSVKKFQDLNRNNLIPSPEQVAKNIIRILPSLKKIKSGSFLDIRNNN
jgi:benzil reductase ((S)-benzoin forming)